MSDTIQQMTDRLTLCRPTWQDAHKLFTAGLLSWTEILPVLMSQCGMSAEAALVCMAEHFDRRGPVIVIHAKEQA